MHFYYEVQSTMVLALFHMAKTILFVSIILKILLKKIVPNGNHCMYTLLHGPKIVNVKILIFCYENDQAHFFPLAKCNEQKSSPNAKSQMMIFRKRC